MRRNRLAVIGSALVLASALAAGTAAGGGGGPAAAPGAVATPPPPPTDADDFTPELFDATSATIDNPFLPLPPGTRWVWRGRAFEDGERVERKVIFTVTDLTKVVAGVRTRVGWDRDFNDGVLGEGELIFLAQDIYGNVWHLGQYRETFDEEEFVGGRVWVVGDPVGAEAGLMMLADHEVGDTYSQGFAPPPWNWDDHARVVAVGEHTCVPVGCFDDVLIVKEFEPTKPGAYQLKYYAPGVGNVRVGWGGRNEEEREVMVLVKWFELTPEALAAARERVLEMEHRAYAYGRTDPAEPG